VQKCRRGKSRTFTVDISFLFVKTYLTLENELDKVVTVVGSNNTEANRRFGSGAPDAKTILTVFPKNMHF